MAKGTPYVESSDYIPKEIRKKLGIGEYKNAGKKTATGKKSTKKSK